MKLEYKYDTNSTSYDNNGSMREQKVTVPTANGTAGFTATQTYSYDALNRLGSAEETIAGSTTLKQTFEIDRYGNRRFDTSTSGLTTTLGSCTTMCNPTFDATNNRITSSGFSFDSSGNTTRDAADRKFTYDAENKQTKAETLSAGTNTVTGTIGEYSYDGDGKRVKKHVPSTGETTIFVYDAADKQIAEYSTIVADSTDAKVAYLTADHLGSPRINTDVNGAVTARHDYHPFGEEIYTSQRTTALNYSADTLRKQFTGYERDDETNLDFAEARMYANRLGRFSRPDSVFSDSSSVDPQSWNLYLYGRNNPLTFVDPIGKSIFVAIGDLTYEYRRDKNGGYFVDGGGNRMDVGQDYLAMLDQLYQNGYGSQIRYLIDNGSNFFGFASGTDKPSGSTYLSTLGNTNSFGMIDNSSGSFSCLSILVVAQAIDSAYYLLNNNDNVLSEDSSPLAPFANLWNGQAYGPGWDPYATAQNPNQRISGQNWDHGYGESATAGWTEYEMQRANFYNNAVTSLGCGEAVEMAPLRSPGGRRLPRPGEYWPGLSSPPSGSLNDDVPPPPPRRLVNPSDRRPR